MSTGRSVRIARIALSVAGILYVPATSPVAVPQEITKIQTRHAIAEDDRYVAFLINNIFNYYSNNGDGSFNPFSQTYCGFEFPKGSDKTTTFEDGMLWGGFHKGRPTPKAGGSVYRHGLQAGRIIQTGTLTSDPVAEDPSLATCRIYRVRPSVNPGTPYTPAMESMLNQEEWSLINRFTPTTPRVIYDQYIRDWNEWPAADGAPFRDVNSNGTYEPLIDIPGYPGADQTLFYIANDCNPTRAQNTTSSPIIGLEIQRTIWGYRRDGSFGNTVFISTRIINKSGAPVDSMYVGQWFDADVGDASNDFLGCDTLGNLGYTYNGISTDQMYGTRPPAVGFTLLQGPVVPGTSGDTALTLGRLRPGYRNLGMTAFAGFLSGFGVYRDPVSGPGGDVEWYRLMHGTPVDSSTRYIDPSTGRPTAYVFSGDPVSARGWLDGPPYLPGDRRCMLSSGPFRMAPGDTQEVVLAHSTAQGTDRLSSVVLLKASAAQIAGFFRSQARTFPPTLQTTVSYPSASEAEVHLTADLSPEHPQSITALLKSTAGAAIAQFTLLDDGMHGDGVAGDGIFGSSVVFSRQRAPLSVSLEVTTSSGSPKLWQIVQPGIITAGEVLVTDAKLYSDNFNNDGVANPGENIRFGFTLRSLSYFPLENVRITTGESSLIVPRIEPGQNDTMKYAAGDPGSYCSYTVPSTIRESGVPLPVEVADTNGNVWVGSIFFTVSQLPYPPVGLILPQSGGRTSGSFGLLVVDPAQLTNHRYIIRGVDSIGGGGTHGFTLMDSTDGRILLHNHSLPDDLGHTVPMTDGFKILRGTIDQRSGAMKSLDILEGNNPWSTAGVSNVLGLEGYFGTIGNAFEHWPSGGVDYPRHHSVRIVFSSVSPPASDSAVSFAYRYVEHANAPPARPEFVPFIHNPAGYFAYQEYTTGFPFAAYDVTDHPPRRLMVGYLENNVPLGLLNGVYEPPHGAPYDNGSVDGPREWFFIFDVPYSLIPDPSLQRDITAERVPLMWVGYPARWSSLTRGSQLLLTVTHAPEAADWWSFTVNRDEFIPASFQLLQNFPNPFNAGTTIRLTVPDPSYITLKIYNLLGQEVRTMLNTYQYPGAVDVRWDGTNTAGIPVASGVYFYRLEATRVADNRQAFVQVYKMMVIR